MRAIDLVCLLRFSFAGILIIWVVVDTANTMGLYPSSTAKIAEVTALNQLAPRDIPITIRRSR